MILIEGCPRSGTSIVGELLRDHPACSRYAYEEWEPFSGVPLDAPGTVAKQPRHFTPADGLGSDPTDLPAGPTIWVVRHPLDAIASLRPIMKRRWAAWPPPPTGWVAKDWMGRAALLWLHQNDTGYQTALDTRGAPVLVRLEDVIADPSAQAARILAHLDWPHARTVDVWVARVSDDPTRSPAAHQDFWYRPHDHRVGRWDEELTDTQADDLWGLVADVASSRYGYTREGTT